MAEDIKKDVVIEFKTKNSEAAQKELDKTKEGLGSVNKAQQANTKATQQSNKANQRTPGILKKVTGGFKALGGAFKALGIGLIVGLIVKLTEVLNKNQKFVDAFAKANEILSRVFNDLFTLLSDNFGTVVDFFKGVFENPLESVKALGEAVKNNIIERFESAITVFGLAGKAIRQFLDGDFSGAANTAQQAGKELTDVITGVDGSFDKIVETTVNAGNAIKDYATETYNAADAQVELRKQAQLAEARIAQSIFLYQNEIEQLRQVRDNIDLNLDEREKANAKIGELLQKQGEEERRLAQLRVNAAAADLAANEDNVDLQVALINAKTELADVEERITGFQSEQLINEQALREERRANLQEIERIGQTRQELAETELRQQLENQRLLIERTISNEQEKNAALMMAEKQFRESLAELEAERREKQLEAEEAERERLQTKFETELEQERQNFATRFALIQEQRNAILENEKINENQRTSLLQANSKARLQLERTEAEEKQKLQDQVQQNVLNGVAALGEALGFGKEIAIAGALIDTFQGIAAGVKLGFPLAIPAVAAASATGFAAVKNITSTPLPPTPAGASGTGRGGGGGSAQSTPPPTPPSFNLVGQANTSSITQSENIGNDQPVNAVVVSREVSSQLQADRNAQQQSTF